MIGTGSSLFVCKLSLWCFQGGAREPRLHSMRAPQSLMSSESSTKGDTVNSVENDTSRTAPLSGNSSSHDELSSWLDLKPGMVMMTMMMIGDIRVRVTVMNEITPRAAEVPKKIKNDHLLSCQSVALSAQLGATRRAPTSHKEQPLNAVDVADQVSQLRAGSSASDQVFLSDRFPGGLLAFFVTDAQGF